MRPYIICHMVASIDGRIDCAMVDQISGDEYYTTLEELDCPTLLEGRVTLEHYSARKERFIADDPTPVHEPSTYKALESDAYMIAVDTRGRLQWPSPEIDGVPLLCIVSEEVSAEYLEMLRSEGISWICVGRHRIDLPAAMEILHDEFGVERLAVLGGGHINGGFLEKNLIDEISLLLAPGIDGRSNQPALFDGIRNPDPAPVSLRLMSATTLPNQTLWLRYKIPH